MKKFVPYIAIIALFLTGFFIARNEHNENQLIKRSEILLGTVVEIQVRDSDKNKAEDAISKAFDEFRRIDKKFSVYDEESPVWKINHSKAVKIKVDDEIYSLLQKCDAIWKSTNKSFDVSLDSLTELWGFGNNGKPSLPSDEKIKAALNNCGWQNISLHNENYIQIENNVHLNFGAVAKGYAVDCAINLLKKLNVKDALINAGGEIRQIGIDWIVGVQDPDDNNSVIKKIKLDKKAVATSGNYEQYFERDGIRYCHILDPLSGYSSQYCKSVTVIADDDLTADALATGMFVLGPEKGIELAKQIPGIEVYIIDKDNKEYFSPGFSKYILR